MTTNFMQLAANIFGRSARPVQPSAPARAQGGTNLVLRFMDEAHTKIVEVFTREKLAFYRAGRVQGPLVVSLSYRPHNPTTGQIRQFLGLGMALQSALGLDNVRVQLINGLITVELPSPFPVTPTAEAMYKLSGDTNVCVGWNMNGDGVQFDMARHGAVAFVGPSRRGKTQALRATLYSAARAVGPKLRYAIVAQPAKIADWAAFDSSKHSLGIASEPGEMVACVQWFAEQARVGAPAGYRYVLVIDDLPSILAVANIASGLGFIASNGAGVGAHVWLGTQMLGSNAGSGGQLIESNVSCRVVYKPSSNATGARNSGQGGLDTGNLSTLPGDAIALIDGHAQRIATARCNDTTINQLTPGRMVNWHRLWAGAGAVQTPVQEAVQPVQTPVRTPVQAGATRVESGGAAPVQTPVQEPIAIPVDREPNRLQRWALYEHYLATGSKTQTLISVYGSKNSQRLAWLNRAIVENEED